ncbi:FmdB family zinc ribbon protein [Micromonospora sp. B11E3]|uniref:FmdB family zinc ribbon protein n=1 Tax=Micromonospora sp. B11E3 TaxID=3153562 RepID=UPI00325E2828
MPDPEENVPTYQYACTACGHQLEAVQSFSDEPLTECPACEGQLRKLFNSVGIVFKGSGFYRTDSRSGSGSGSDTAKNGSGKPAKSESSSGGDSGSSSTSGGSTSASNGSSGSSGSSSGGAAKAPAASAS